MEGGEKEEASLKRKDDDELTKNGKILIMMIDEDGRKINILGTFGK